MYNQIEKSQAVIPTPINEQVSDLSLKPKKRKTNLFIIASLLLAITAIGITSFFITRSTDSSSVNHEKTTHEHTDETAHESIEAPEKAQINPSKIPLGDGKYGTRPQIGYIYSCQSNLSGPGAFKDGPWIDAANGLWSKTDKDITVDGNVTWTNASFQINASSQTRELIGNGLPINHGTGIFPISSTDDAYSYDRNPNTIKAQNILYSLPINPVVASEPTCLPVGEIGYTTNGVALFNALDAGGRDAAAHEIQDTCNGHPERSGAYHYHDYSDCVQNGTSESPVLIGYALDGFGIYKYAQNPTNADLDECHGKTGLIKWDGNDVTMYHYVITTEYPYTLGCFKAKLN